MKRVTVGPITQIISGGARGADKLGEQYALEYHIPIRHLPAEWYKYGKRAGIIRNTDIVRLADIVVAFWDGKSPGTRHTIAESKRLGKTCYIITKSKRRN